MKRSKTLWASVALLVLTISGCAVHHEHHPPTDHCYEAEPAPFSQVSEQNMLTYREHYESAIDREDLAQVNEFLRTENARLLDGGEPELVLVRIAYYDSRDMPGDKLILTPQGATSGSPIEIPLRGAGPAMQAVCFEPGYHRIPIGIYLATVINNGKPRFTGRRLIRIDRRPDCKIVRDRRGITVARISTGTELILFVQSGFDVLDR